MKRLRAAARMIGVVAGLDMAAAPAYAAEEDARMLILNALDPYPPWVDGGRPAVGTVRGGGHLKRAFDICETVVYRLKSI